MRRNIEEGGTDEPMHIIKPYYLEHNKNKSQYNNKNSVSITQIIII